MHPLIPRLLYNPLQVDAYEEVPAAARLPPPLMAAVYGRLKQLGGGRLACKEAEVTEGLRVLASQVDAYIALPEERKLPAPVLATVFAAAEQHQLAAARLPSPQGQGQGQGRGQGRGQERGQGQGQGKRRVSFVGEEGIVSEGGVRPRRASILGPPKTEAEKEEDALSVEDIVAAELAKLQVGPHMYEICSHQLINRAFQEGAHVHTCKCVHEMHMCNM